MCYLFVLLYFNITYACIYKEEYIVYVDGIKSNVMRHGKSTVPAIQRNTINYYNIL